MYWRTVRSLRKISIGVGLRSCSVCAMRDRALEKPTEASSARSSLKWKV